MITPLKPNLSVLDRIYAMSQGLATATRDYDLSIVCHDMGDVEVLVEKLSKQVAGVSDSGWPGLKALFILGMPVIARAWAYKGQVTLVQSAYTDDPINNAAQTLRVDLATINERTP